MSALSASSVLKEAAYRAQLLVRSAVTGGVNQSVKTQSLPVIVIPVTMRNMNALDVQSGRIIVRTFPQGFIPVI